MLSIETSAPMSENTKSKLVRLGQALVYSPNRVALPKFNVSCYQKVFDYLKHPGNFKIDYQLWAVRYDVTPAGGVDHVFITDQHDRILCDLYEGKIVDGKYVPLSLNTGTGKHDINDPFPMEVTCRMKLWVLRDLYLAETKDMKHTSSSKKILLATLAKHKVLAKPDLATAMRVAIDGSNYYLNRAGDLFDYVSAVAGYVKSDCPEFAANLMKALSKFRNKEHAGYYNWASLKGEKWYKATMLLKLGPFEEKERVWIKINTENPLSLGKTVWIYGPKTSRVMHVKFDILGDYLRLYLEEGKPVSATPKEQKILDAAWITVVQPIINGWKKSQKIAKRLLDKKA